MAAAEGNHDARDGHVACRHLGADRRQRPDARLPAGRESRARERLRRFRSSPAGHCGGEHGRRTRERAPLRRDAAPAEGDRAARGRACRHQRIQDGMAAELDFQAIIDLVGDKLREVFHTGDIGIRWYDAKADLIHYVYQYEHGVRRNVAPRPPTPGGRWFRMVETRQPIVMNSRAEFAVRVRRPSGHRRRAAHLVSVPISRQRPRARARSRSKTTNARTPSATPRCDCSARSPRAWAWRSRTRASSTRRSAS